MPGEEEAPPGATAVAEAPPPVPEAEQEPEAPEAPESGAPPEDEGEEQDPTASLLAIIDQLAEGDEGVAKALKEKYGVTEEKVADQLLGMETQQVKQLFHSEWNQAYQASQSFAREAVQQDVFGAFQELGDAISKGVSELASATSQEAIDAAKGKLGLDARSWSDAVTEQVNQARTAAWAQAATSARFHLANAITGHQAYRHLPKEGRDELNRALYQYDYQKAMALILDAALTAAPEAIKKQAETAAEKKAGLLKAAQELQERIGTNGRRKSLTGAKGTDTRSDEERLADPKTPPSELEAILRRQGKL